MTENAFFAAFFFSCTAAVLIFAFKYASGVAQARARLAQDGAYQELAQSMAAAQAETADHRLPIERLRLPKAHRG